MFVTWFTFGAAGSQWSCSGPSIWKQDPESRIRDYDGHLKIAVPPFEVNVSTYFTVNVKGKQTARATPRWPEHSKIHPV